MLISILTTKIIDLGVKIFYLVKGVQLKCFLVKIALKFKSKLEKSFYFKLISRVLFFVFCFLKLFIGLSKCLGSFLGISGQNWIENKFLG